MPPELNEVYSNATYGLPAASMVTAGRTALCSMTSKSVTPGSEGSGRNRQRNVCALLAPPPL